MLIVGILFLAFIFYLISFFVDKKPLSFYATIFIITVLIYAPIAYFVYKGKKWSLVLMIILWTLEKGYQLAEGKGGIVIILFWLIIVTQFFKALKFEYGLSGSKNPKKEVEKVFVIILFTVLFGLLGFLFY